MGLDQLAGYLSQAEWLRERLADSSVSAHNAGIAEDLSRLAEGLLKLLPSHILGETKVI